MVPSGVFFLGFKWLLPSGSGASLLFMGKLVVALKMGSAPKGQESPVLGSRLGSRRAIAMGAKHLYASRL